MLFFIAFPPRHSDHPSIAFLLERQSTFNNPMQASDSRKLADLQPEEK